MSKRRFTKEQIDELLKNPNIETCSEKSISYSKNFKELAIKQKQEGFSNMKIFIQAGFDVDLIGREIPDYCLHRWLKVFRNKGLQELNGLLIQVLLMNYLSDNVN